MSTPNNNTTSIALILIMILNVNLIGCTSRKTIEVHVRDRVSLNPVSYVIVNVYAYPNIKHCNITNSKGVATIDVPANSHYTLQIINPRPPHFSSFYSHGFEYPDEFSWTPILIFDEQNATYEVRTQWHDSHK